MLRRSIPLLIALPAAGCASDVDRRGPEFSAVSARPAWELRQCLGAALSARKIPGVAMEREGGGFFFELHQGPDDLPAGTIDARPAGSRFRLSYSGDGTASPYRAQAVEIVRGCL